MSDAAHRARRRSRLPAAIAAIVAMLASAPAAVHAGIYKPPNHRVFHGVSDTGDVADFRAFKAEVGAHPAVLEDFYHWGTPLTTGALDRWDAVDARGVLSLSTAPGGGAEVISPGAIAKGRDDLYMLKLNDAIAASGQVVYLRLFPEMNGSWNPYCAFNADGTARGYNHGARDFRNAWKRFTLIARGGKRAEINRTLQRLGMPRILRATSGRDPIYRQEGVRRRLPEPRVAMLWNPQTIGSPAIRGNGAKAYWPGRRYVDWVGADIYSKYASAMPHLGDFYRHWNQRPFFIGEYSPWDNDYYGSFTRSLFRWAHRHGRTRMLIYYRSVYAGSPYDIGHFPAAREVLRGILSRPHYMQFAPGTHD